MSLNAYISVIANVILQCERNEMKTLITAAALALAATAASSATLDELTVFSATGAWKTVANAEEKSCVTISHDSVRDNLARVYYNDDDITLSFTRRGFDKPEGYETVIFFKLDGYGRNCGKGTECGNHYSIFQSNGDDELATAIDDDRSLDLLNAFMSSSEEVSVISSKTRLVGVFDLTGFGAEVAKLSECEAQFVF